MPIFLSSEVEPTARVFLQPKSKMSILFLATLATISPLKRSPGIPHGFCPLRPSRSPGGGQRDPGLRQRLPGEPVAPGGFAEDPRLFEAIDAQAAAGASCA